MLLTEIYNPDVFQRGFEQEKQFGKYRLVAKPGYFPLVPGKRATESSQFRIETYQGKSLVAWVNFEKVDDHLEALDVVVQPAHRRRGIASAMYQFARDLGNDIKPSSKQTSLGKKFWTDKTSQPLTERVSSIIYHYTSTWAAERILESGKFQLSSTLGSDIEYKFSPPGYRYFMSATRTLLGGYHDFVAYSAAMFVLDGDWFNSRYPGGPVDYWENRAPSMMYGKPHEAEDRIFSRSASIPLGGVRSVHILVLPDADNQHRVRARRALIAAKKRNIPAYFYTDKEAWKRLDTSKQASVSVLRADDDSMPSYTRRNRGSLMPLMELIFARDKSKLGKDAQRLLYTINYSARSAANSLTVDLGNARKPTSGPDREHAVKIISFMQKNKLDSITDLVDYISKRWASPITESAGLRIDVPSEEWLSRKQEYARKRGRDQWGAPYFGTVTARPQGDEDVMVSVVRLELLKGMRNEQSNVRVKDLAWLMNYMERTGHLPLHNGRPYVPFIMVAYNGEAWVNEGNHRIMAAYRLGWKQMPVEIAYFDGGERVKDGIMYPGKIGLGEPDKLDELNFLGSPCTKDCSGHRAGYDWHKRNGRTPNSWSQSFNNGAALSQAGK